MENIRNRVLSDGNPLEIAGKIYKSKYSRCKEGFIDMSTSHTNTGILIVPDTCNLTEDMQKKHFLAANYNAKTEDAKAEIEKNFVDEESKVIEFLKEKRNRIRRSV